MCAVTAESELEVAFFRDLQKELKKISLFYSSEEKRCQFRFHQLRAVLKDLKVRTARVSQVHQFVIADKVVSHHAWRHHRNSSRSTLSKPSA